MRILALDTSTEACSAALLIGDEVRLRFELTERSHAELVLPMIDLLLREAAVAPASLDAIAFGRGPGAFTGLRIAAGVAQGLAFGAGVPVVPVSSLAAVAEQVRAVPDEGVLICNDARMGEIYWSVFKRPDDAAVVPFTDETVSAPDLVARAPLATTGGEAVQIRHAAGNALARYETLRRRLVEEGIEVHDSVYPRADAIARLAVVELRLGRAVRPDMALPVYVRDDVARPSGPAVTGMS